MSAFLNPGSLEAWIPGCLESWIPGILESWNRRILKFKNPGILDFLISWCSISWFLDFLISRLRDSRMSEIKGNYECDKCKSHQTSKAWHAQTRTRHSTSLRQTSEVLGLQKSLDFMDEPTALCNTCRFSLNMSKQLCEPDGSMVNLLWKQTNREANMKQWSSVASGIHHVTPCLG